MATAPNPNIRIPINQFVDPFTGRPTQEWLLWLLSPNVYTLNLSSPLTIPNGGTGIGTLPTNGQLLIGNAGTYSLGSLGQGAGIQVTNGAGAITIANTGVLSFSAGTTGLTPSSGATGNVSLAGVLKAVNGGTGQSNYTIGDLLYADSATTLAKLADVATGNALISGGVGAIPSWGKIGLTTHVSGTLAVGNGGTGLSTLTAANNALYSTGASTLTAGTLPVAAGGSGAVTLTGYLKGNGTSAFTAVSSIPYTDVSGLGTIVTQNLGATGTFKSADTPAKTITVTNGIITSIV
jgi:hypothetical protein